MFIPILCLMSLALAEPKVNDAYTLARAVNDHYQDYYASDHERLSEGYDAQSEIFASARKEPSNGYQYKSPNSKSSNARGTSINPAAARVSFNQFSLARKAAEDHVSPNARALTQKHSAHNEVSQADPPAVMSLSIENAIPDAVLTISKKNLTVVDRNQKSELPASKFHNTQLARGLSQNRSMYESKFQFQDFQADSRKNNVNNTPSKLKKVTESNVPAFVPPTPLPQGIPSSKSFHGNSSLRTNGSPTDSTSQTLAALKQITYTETAPNARVLPQKDGVPSTHSNLTSAELSSYNSTGSRSSSPSNKSAKPSDQYGIPEQLNASSQGYFNVIARAVKELRNQDPPSYDFGYQIEDEESGNDFGHGETREEDRAQGAVMLPDGNQQTVEYEAEESGFKPRISMEPAVGGYDDNAMDIGKSTEGSY